MKTMKTVKIDYTLTPEFEEARFINNMVRTMIMAMKNPPHGQAFFNNGQAGTWQAVYSEARRANDIAAKSFIRTVCKIAARILFVLLLVGIGVGVMLK